MPEVELTPYELWVTKTALEFAMLKTRDSFIKKSTSDIHQKYLAAWDAMPVWERADALAVAGEAFE